MSWMVQCSDPGRSKRFFTSPNYQDRLWTYVSPYSVGTRDSVSGDKTVRVWSWPFTASSASGIRNEWNCAFVSPICLMADTRTTLQWNCEAVRYVIFFSSLLPHFFLGLNVLLTTLYQMSFSCTFFNYLDK